MTLNMPSTGEYQFAPNNPYIGMATLAEGKLFFDVGDVTQAIQMLEAAVKRYVPCRTSLRLNCYITDFLWNLRLGLYLANALPKTIKT